MKIREAARSLAIALLPTRSGWAFRIARRIVNDHNGDNNFVLEENGELRLARLVLPHARTAFDVGANVGDWTRHALAINPSLTVHAFEPSATTYRTLVASGLPPNVHPNPFALGAATDDRELYIFDENGGSNSIYNRVGTPSTSQRSERIHIERLDDYVRQAQVDAIDFLKIDTEGHEYAVLQGSREMLAAGRIGVVQFEYGGCYIDARVLLKDIWEYVRGLNHDYRFFKIFPEELRLMSEYKQQYETYQYSNWAIVHPSMERYLT
jgi:FkbM family methyltransferase